MADHETTNTRAGLARADCAPRRPILEGPQRAAAVEAVDAIAAALQPAVESWAQRWEDPAGIDSASLACGRAGAALFYAYRAAALPDRDDAPAIELLECALEQMCDRAMDCSLYCGFTGLAWVCDQIRALSGDADEENANAEIDEALIEHVSRPRADAEWDLIDGLIGIGVYGLDRLERPAGRTIVEQVVARLDELAKPQPIGISWPTPERRHQEDDRTRAASWSFNLGMAHGVPGAVAFLGAARAAGAASNAAQRLLDGAAPWLLGQRVAGDSVSCFPHFCGPDLESVPSRCAWCYGDPGVAAALLVASRASDRADWLHDAVAVARHAAARRAERHDVRDAGLCHGAGGVGHIFNRLHQVTGDPALREAALYWFERALAGRQATGGIGGFRTWSHERVSAGEWIDDPRFLTGAAGIGLALLAAATELPPAWDRCMLLSVRADSEARP